VLLGILWRVSTLIDRFFFSVLAHLGIADTLIRAIGKRAHAMHAMVSFSTIGMLLASVG
jgi:hypothetical protein